MGNVTAWERLPTREARYADFPEGLNPRLTSALRARGTAPLFTHQAAAVEAALAGENVVVVTGTSSGKTLCYNLPVLQAALADSEARALYLFPTKALAQDQASVLAEMLRTLDAEDQVPVRTYDGDTPSAGRREVRDRARILITNPDMLHMGILPHHPKWTTLFENLQWIVLDELHVYRGVFGSNVANLLRRLRRICHFYGSDPNFALTSATIANPKELAEKLIEAPVRLIPPDLDGSPRAEKHVILYNPPVIDAALENEIFMLQNAGGPWAQRLHDDEEFRGALRELRRESYIALVVDFRDGIWPWNPPYFSVNEVAVQRMTTPMLVLPGSDAFHPTGVGQRICADAVNASCLAVDARAPENLPATIEAIRSFLREHS